MDMVFSIMGLLGGVLCAVGDVLFDFKGQGNEKLGKTKMIDSNWIKMAYWRFGASILAAFFGDAFVGFGIFSLGEQIRPSNAVLASVMEIFGCFGVIGGFFVHSVLCLQAVIYKKIMEENNFPLAEKTLGAFHKAIIVPFFLGYFALMIPCICGAIAVLAGYLSVPMWFALLNPVVFMFIGVTMRKIDPKLFNDLPGIVMPSLGLGMMGLIGIVNLM
ncbi:MAG: hypothetical protein NC084_12455 [Bacteroides sp.]|nr:hypothetical protein [Eubacterium sp.]MCM1419211.1 hypothetical protein [Roseburia sp.]MCM1463504.1 hypothetical protein [Bacteroides sp.]